MGLGAFISQDTAGAPFSRSRGVGGAFDEKTTALSPAGLVRNADLREQLAVKPWVDSTASQILSYYHASANLGANVK